MDNKYKIARGRSHDRQRVSEEQDWDLTNRYDVKPDIVQQALDMV